MLRETKAPTKPTEIQEAGQAVPPVTDVQATTVVTTVPAAVEGAGHPEVESTEAILATSLLPVR